MKPINSFSKEQLQIAFRNREIPLEGLRYPITPVGLHYLLVHSDMPEVDVNEWRLKVTGRVSESLSLSLEEIKKRPARKVAVTMECAGNGRALLSRPTRQRQQWFLGAVGTAEWTGTPLRGILDQAILEEDAVEVIFSGLDKAGEEGAYSRSLRLEEALRDEVLLVYEMNGEPLQPQHGFPLRLLVPGWYGMASVKWLDEIRVSEVPFKGSMQEEYKYRQDARDPGVPVELIRVRTLMIPPGIPKNFSSGKRLVEAGPVRLAGKAWAGRRRISRVEVSTDGGSTWSEAQLGEPVSPYAWTEWQYSWLASPGDFVVCARAADADGNLQPLEQEWNYGGFGNNGIQHIQVEVRAPST